MACRCGRYPAPTGETKAPEASAGARTQGRRTRSPTVRAAPKPEPISDPIDFEGIWYGQVADHAAYIDYDDEGWSFGGYL